VKDSKSGLSDPDDRFKVLFVCTGNTCRSPMAAGILKNMLRERGIDNIEVSSAGISAADGFPATQNAIIACRDWGIDISEHRSRLLDLALVESNDLVLVMTPEHLGYVKSMTSSNDHVYLIKRFPEKSSDGKGPEVADPIGRPLEDYGRTFLELDEIIRKIFADIVSMSKNSNDGS
jgi:protein-tyrosine-phosphatase